MRSKWFWGSLIVILIFFIVMISVRLNLQWFWLLLYAVITVPFAPFIRSPIKFFRYTIKAFSLPRYATGAQLYCADLRLEWGPGHYAIMLHRGGLDDNASSGGSLVLLAASVSISWVFAKSIQNVSLLGAQYGLVGCAAYGKCFIPQYGLVNT